MACWRSISRFFIVPILVYAAGLYLLSYPWLNSFRTDFLTNAGDGMQNVWNMWWVNKSITELHQQPFTTRYLHYPHGTTLLGHTLNPFNGLVAVILLRFLPLVQAYNTMVVFSFVVGGWTAFLLAWRFSGTYTGSLLAGFFFTFSSFHFAHAQEHMQLVSVEWVPLFLLSFHHLLSRPSPSIAVGSAAALLLVSLCDYYYLFYCILYGLIAGAVLTWESGGCRFLMRRAYVVSLGVFVAIALATAGALPLALLLATFREPWAGAHNPVEWSNDLLGAFIPGGRWRFADLTSFYWSHHSATNVIESNVHVGWGVLIMALLAWRRRRTIEVPGLRVWYVQLIVFWLLSLGPRLHVRGADLGISMPYAGLVKLFPPLGLSGLPIRMMVMVILASTVIFACGFKMLLRQVTAPRVLLLIGLSALQVFEILPAQLAQTSPAYPSYVQALRELPGPGGVINWGGADMCLALYHQTLYDKPQAGGYIARAPSSVWEKDETINQLLRSGRYESLRHDYDFRYLVTAKVVDDPFLHLRYQDAAVRIYALGDD